MYLMAVDLGYGNLKRACGDARGEPQLDVWPACAMPLDRAGTDQSGDVVVDGTPWRVGVSPEAMGSTPEILHRNYLDSDLWRAQLLYALTHDVTVPGKIDQLVLGLPVDEYLDQKLRERAEKAVRALLKSSSMTLPEVDRIAVVLQSFGTYFTANVRLEGALERANVLLIDAGHGTLDWTHIRLGRLQRDGTGTTRQGGVARIIEEVNTRLPRRKGIQVDSGCIRAAIEGDGTIIVKGKSHDCRVLIGEVRDGVVRCALALIRRSIKGLSEGFDVVVLTGGGAEHYHPVVKRLFPRALMHRTDSDVQANVCGLWLDAQNAIAPTSKNDLHPSQDIGDDLTFRAQIRVRGPLKARLLEYPPRERPKMLAALATIGLVVLRKWGA